MKGFTKVFGVLGIILAFGMVSCSDGSGDSGGGSYGGGAAERQNLLQFNRKNMSALAINESASASGQYALTSRSAARSAESDAMLVKILEDGSIENFIEVPSYVTLSDIKYIAQSSAEDADEIYVVFEGTSWGSYREEGSKNWISVEIGQLLCILSDGTYYDILQPERDENGNATSWKSLYTWGDNIEPIQFDDQGYMYYLVYENGKSSNSTTNMIYKFDPATGESTELTAPINGTYYQKFQVSKDGSWIFAQANRWSSNSEAKYLRAIPVSNPAGSINLYYDSTNSTWVNDWYYDENAECVYAVFSDSFVRYPKNNGTFDKNDAETIFSNNGGSDVFYSEALFGDYKNEEVAAFNGYGYAYDLYGNTDGEVCYFFRDPNENEDGGHDLQPAQLAKYLFAKAYESLKESYQTAYKEGVTEASPTYRISFEAFAEIPGYELIATATAGKYDAEAIAAIENARLEALVKTLWDSRGRYAQDSMFGYTKHNFFADIIQEESEGTWSAIDPEKFRMNFANDQYFASCGVDQWALFTTTWTSTRPWKKALLNEDQELDAELFLAKLASYCTGSEIDFSLEAFKDIPRYIGLYTDKKNAEAVAFLDNDIKRQLLNDYLNSIWDSANGAARFLQLTCFKPGTDESAYVWREENNNYFWWGSVRQLTADGKSVYGICGNGSTQGVIRIIDKDGNPDGNFVSALQSYTLTNCVASEDGFFFKESILASNGTESGFHHLQFYNVSDETCTNLFDNIPNKDNSELISYSVGGGYAFCCTAINGFTIASFKIDIDTKAYTELGSNQKLSQIIVIK